MQIFWIRYALICWGSAFVTACRGEQGQGFKPQRASLLTRQPDWYLLKQMENFHTGKRQHTSNPELPEAPENAVAGIVAWLASLSTAAADQ